MQVILAKNWWSLVIRGLAAIQLGVTTVIRNAISIDELALLFFVYALFAGVAVITLQATGADLQLESVIAPWALATGVLEIAAARQLRNHIAGEWLLALSGTASLALGIMTIALPRANTAGIASRVGAYGFAFGIVLIALGFRLRSWSRKSAAKPPASARAGTG